MYLKLGLYFRKHHNVDQPIAFLFFSGFVFDRCDIRRLVAAPPPLPHPHRHLHPATGEENKADMAGGRVICRQS